MVATLQNRPWRWIWLQALLLTLWGTPAWAAAQVQLQVSATRLSPEEQLRVVISATGDYDAMTELSSPGFEFSRAGTQTQVSIINGAMQRIENYTFVGTPTRPGTYVLGPVELLSGGAVVGRSGTAQIQVVGEEPANAVAQSAAAASDLAQYAGKPFFVRPSLSVLQPYVGQAVVVTFELYWSRQVSVQGIRGQTPPNYGDADVQDLQKDEAKAEAVQIGGRPYQRQITHRAVLIAGKAGELRLESPSFKVEVGDFFETRSAKATGPAIALQIRELPSQGKPASFVRGNVGTLAVTGQLMVSGQAAVKHKVKAGERLLLQYDLSGEGNLLGLRDVAPPSVNGMAVEALPGRPNDGVKLGLSGQTGKRSWQYVLSFAQPGRYVLPATEWSHFDPGTERYQTSVLGPLEVEVEGTIVPQQANAAAPAAAGEAAAAVGPATAPNSGTAAAVVKRGPIRPLAATADLAAHTSDPWHAANWVWALVATPWFLGLLWAAGALWGRQRTRRAPLRRRQSAGAQARQALAQAQQSQDPAAAYLEMRRILLTYVADACGADPQQTSERTASELLERAEVAADLRQSLLDELSHCEYARYAPADNRSAELAATAQRIDALLTRLDGPLQRAAPALAAVLLALVTLVAGALAPVSVQAETLDATFAAANQAYLAGELPKAARLYQELLDHKVTTAAVHYNLANTWFRLGRLGKAVGHYRQALAAGPEDALHQDVEGNLSEVRSMLGEQARRRSDTLHVFDESPAVTEALGRAAPRGMLVVGALIFGLGALGLWWRRKGRRGAASWSVLAAAAVVLHLICAAWLGVARYVDATVVRAVVVEEDEPLTACTGIGEPMGLPEGLEVRRLREFADGRVEVRLHNGRQGCVRPHALYTVQR